MYYVYIRMLAIFILLRTHRLACLFWAPVIFFPFSFFMIVSELSSVFPSLLSKLLLTSRSRVRLQIYSSHVVLNGLLPEPSWTELV